MNESETKLLLLLNEQYKQSRKESSYNPMIWFGTDNCPVDDALGLVAVGYAECVLDPNGIKSVQITRIGQAVANRIIQEQSP